MSTDEFDLKIKQKHPHTYTPMRAEKIERGRSYASTMVNDQKTMMENLRFLRQQMEKEERQLKIMKNTLYDRSLPTSSKYRDFGSCNDLSMELPQKKIPPHLSRSQMIEYGNLHANVLVNNQLAAMENLRYLKRQMDREDRKIQLTKDSTFQNYKPKKKKQQISFEERPAKQLQLALYNENDTLKRWKKIEDDVPENPKSTFRKLERQKQFRDPPNGLELSKLEWIQEPPKNGFITDKSKAQMISKMFLKNFPEEGSQEITHYSQGDAAGRHYNGLNTDGWRLLNFADYIFDKRPDMWKS